MPLGQITFRTPVRSTSARGWYRKSLGPFRLTLLRWLVLLKGKLKKKLLKAK
jgi:hypothetical protein